MAAVILPLLMRGADALAGHIALHGDGPHAAATLLARPQM